MKQLFRREHLFLKPIEFYDIFIILEMTCWLDKTLPKHSKKKKEKRHEEQFMYVKHL